jgi:hypothetical protein
LSLKGEVIGHRNQETNQQRASNTTHLRVKKRRRTPKVAPSTITGLKALGEAEDRLSTPLQKDASPLTATFEIFWKMYLCKRLIDTSPAVRSEALWQTK